jgi:hypothetical protein
MKTGTKQHRTRKAPQLAHTTRPVDFCPLALRSTRSTKPARKNKNYQTNPFANWIQILSVNSLPSASNLPPKKTNPFQPCPPRSWRRSNSTSAVPSTLNSSQLPAYSSPCGGRPVRLGPRTVDCGPCRPSQTFSHLLQPKTLGGMPVFRVPRSEFRVQPAILLEAMNTVQHINTRQGPRNVDLRTPPGPEGSNGSLLDICRGHPGISFNDEGRMKKEELATLPAQIILVSAFCILHSTFP